MNSLVLTFCIAGIFILLMQLILLFVISNYIEERFGLVVRGGRNPAPSKQRGKECGIGTQVPNTRQATPPTTKD